MSRSRERFVALPVNQGDAFFLKSPDGSVLVDGGRSVEAFPELFTRMTGQNEVDVVICTHNDADHANGVLGFLQGGLGCREVWLPGRWLAALPHVLRPSEQLVLSLWEQAGEAAEKPALRERIEQFRESRPRPPILEIYGDYLAKSLDWRSRSAETSSSPGDTSETGENQWPHQIIDVLERSAETSEWILSYVDWRIWSWHRDPPRKDPEDLRNALFVGAVAAAKRIRSIASAAYHNGAGVRWFEHRASIASGEHTWLCSLNAKQISYVQPCKQGELVAYLALSTANLESLVFWAPSNKRPGVLFTADSDLNGIRLPNLEGALITAPHHGSDANRAAYQAVVSTIPSRPVNWVRSDGRFFRSRPGSAYLNATGRRFCTLCRSPQPVPKQAVDLFARSGAWVRHRKTRPCACQ
jgi:hypothetical protein